MTLNRPMLIAAIVAVTIGAGTTNAFAQDGDQQGTSTDAAASAAADQVGAPTPDHTVALELRGGVQYVPDSSFDAVNDSNSFGAGSTVVLSYGLDYVGIRGLRAFLLGQWGSMSTDRFNSSVGLNWRRGLYLVGAEYGPWTFGTFRPLVRLAGGYAATGLDVEPSEGAALTDRAHDIAGLGTVGFEWLTPRGFLNSPVRFGALGQFGYLAQTSADFDNLSASADGDFTRESLEMGSLPGSGIYWDLGISFVYEW